MDGSGIGLAAVEGKNNESTTERPCFVGHVMYGEMDGRAFPYGINSAIHLAKPVVGKTLIGTEDWSWIVHGWIMESR